MIKLAAPLQTKTLSPILTGSDVLGNKIRGNYESMTSKITPEEFLHMTTMPPEYYFGDGGMTQIFAEQNISSQQNLNVEIVNQLLNRIQLSENENLTYQDTVYIENALRKIGVQDTKEFMHEVRECRKDRETFRELLTGYIANYESLKEVAEFVREKEREETPKQEGAPAKTEQRYFLQQKIYDRLQTGAIYQTLANFYRGVEGVPQPIRNEQAKTAEQEGVSWQILLNRFQNDIFQTETPLLYHSENHYELGGDEILKDEQTVLNEMSSAILLQMIRTVFEQEQHVFHTRNQKWAEYSSVIYDSAQNTLKRFVEYHTSELKRLEAKQYSENRKQMYEEETNLITEISNYVSDYTAIHEQNLEEQRSMVHKVYENYDSTRNEYSMMQMPDGEMEEPAVMEYPELPVEDGQESLLLREELLTQRMEELAKREEERSRVIDEIKRLVETKHLTEKDLTHVIHDRDVLNEILEEADKQDSPKLRDEVITRRLNEMIRREEEHRFVVDEIQREVTSKRQTETDLTHVIHDTAWDEEGLGETPEREPQPLRDEVIAHRIDQITKREEEHRRVLDDIRREARTEKRSVIDRTHAIHDTLRALEHPEEVLEQYMNSETTVEHTDRVLEERLEKVLPKETIEIFSKVANYYQNPEAAVRNGDVIINPESVLQAEMTYIQQEQPEGESIDGSRKEEKLPAGEQFISNTVYQNNKNIQMKLTQLSKEAEQSGMMAGELYHPADTQYKTEIERIFDEAGQIPTMNEEKEEILGSLVNRFTKIKKGQDVSYMDYVEAQPVSIVHKTMEQGLDEEIVEEMIKKHQVVTKQQDTVTKTVTEQHVTNEQIQHVVEERMVQNIQDINEEMKKSLQRQMGEISEQVYHRLEKRLQSERRRRGF